MTVTTQKTAHEDLHSEQGAIRGERPARARNPVIKVEGLAWRPRTAENRPAG